LSVLTWVGVAAFGGAGAVTRFLLDTLIGRAYGRDLPLGTLVINVTGAFLLGLLTGLALSGDALVLAGTATLGSYTTFSTWLFETHRLGEDARWHPALANIAVSLAAGIVAAAIGRTIGAAL
jgi:CrcB protein